MVFDYDNRVAEYSDETRFSVPEETRDMLSLWYYFRDIGLGVGRRVADVEPRGQEELRGHGERERWGDRAHPGRRFRLPGCRHEFFGTRGEREDIPVERRAESAGDYSNPDAARLSFGEPCVGRGRSGRNESKNAECRLQNAECRFEERMKAYAVILAGGRGERFWPMSRGNFPKQFLSLFGPESLVQMTSRRVAGVCHLSDQRFVIDRALGTALAKQLKLTKRNFVYEPFGRNTAPAIALAAAYIAREDPDSVMAVLPADHLIEDLHAFQSALRFAAEVAGMGYLVTFGIKPERPDTGYGYIEVGALLTKSGAGKAFGVRRFREKPDVKLARRFLKQGNFWWNSGMFVWRTDVFLKAVERCMPEFFP